MNQKSSQLLFSVNSDEASVLTTSVGCNGGGNRKGGSTAEVAAIVVAVGSTSGTSGVVSSYLLMTSSMTEVTDCGTFGGTPSVKG